MIKIHISNENYFKALLICKKVIAKAKEFNNLITEIKAKILKAFILAKIQYVSKAIKSLRSKNYLIFK